MKRILILMLMSLVMLTVTSMASMASGAAEPFTEIDARKLKTMLDNDAAATVVIDSRSRAEYDQAHIRGAVSLPLPLMTADPSRLNFSKASKLVFYCSGST